MGTLAWEDGLYVSDDGLSLFSFYMPADLIKWVSFVGTHPICPAVANFIRGEALTGTDFDLQPPLNNPWGCTDGVLHSEIAVASRPTTADEFSGWKRHSLSKDFVYDGGFVSSLNGDGTFDLIFSQSTDNNKNDIFWVRESASLSPALASPVSLSATINTDAQQDNPHLERLDAKNLVLLFDNHGIGDADTQIRYSVSGDDGASWSTPKLLSINSDMATEDLQGHLFKDSAHNWWLYFSSNRAGQVEIYRAKHRNNDLIGDFDNWAVVEKVIGVGAVLGDLGVIAAVGEPSLTSNGDLYFVVVYCKEATEQTAYDSCDIDPWYAALE
ncbi:MAG: hypothetical protein JRH20_30500 [Deltaproteobacteria bacterium]|nr:hypothetical protein [Deltaproteobacteria bacterium]